VEFSRNIDTEPMSRRERARVEGVKLIISQLQQSEHSWPVIERPDTAQLGNTAQGPPEAR